MNNEYDNDKFFAEYAKMSRSKDGLSSAGEWHQLKSLFPPLEGKMFSIWVVAMDGIANMQRSREQYGCWDLI